MLGESYPFRAAGLTFTIVAACRSGEWELEVRDDIGRPRNTWKPNRVMIRNDPETTIPALLRTLAAMVQDGHLPLTPPLR